MKRGTPRINIWDLTAAADNAVLLALPGQRADGHSTHRHPRWGGARRGSGRKKSGQPSAARFVKLTSALTLRHVAFLDAHRVQFETASRSASLRTILDEYIAVVPGLAETLDQIVGRSSR
jgi:hypothetical protein